MTNPADIIDTLKTALEFYANEKRYEYNENCSPCFDNPGMDMYGEGILEDEGITAREALYDYDTELN